MECTFIVILILTTSFEVVQATFSCWPKSESDCTIANVTPKDNIIEINKHNNNYNYNNGRDQTISTLTIINSTIDEIPPISSNYISLYYLSCVGCGLTDITKHSFSHSQSILSNLQTLNISVGSFSILQRKLFSPLPLLIRLNVSHGIISKVDDEAFFNLGKLQYLDLSNNNISKVTPRMFTALESLLHLDISFNHIKILDDGLFVNNARIQYLDLANNDINKIYGRLFHHGCDPSSFNVSYNELSILDAMNCNVDELYVNNNRLKQLSISSKVKKLTADHNIIENVTCDGEANQLSILSLSNNSMAELGCIGSLSQLTKLYLSYNNLGKLNQSSFAALTALTQLHLKSANISKLEYGVFSHQNKLRMLDLSYNQMGNIALDVLLAAIDLQHLYIDGNNITEFSYIDLRKTFSGLLIIKQLNSDNISTTISSGSKVITSHNINGIRCIDGKETLTSSWITSLAINDNTTSAIIRQVKRLSEDISAVKEQNFKINSDILTIRADILKIELTKTNNISSVSSDTMWTQINQLNNITLEKQQISYRIQMQEINELKFETEQNNRRISDCALRIEKLVKDMTMLQSTSTDTNKHNSSHPDVNHMKNVNIILITLIVTFFIYKGYKFVRNDIPRFTRYNTTNTLHTNIIEMDNNSNK